MRLGRRGHRSASATEPAARPRAGTRQLRAIITISTVSLLVTLSSTTGYVYEHLNRNIHTAGDLNTLTNRPPALVAPTTAGSASPTASASSASPTPSAPSGGPPINILLLGSQTRDGQLGQFGGSDSTGSFGGSLGTDLSDTSMLLHISGDRKHAIVVSIPRDTLVDRPDCPTRDGKGTVPGQHRAMFDASMSLGGPLCAAATVEQYFHVRVDHFVRLDFNGFRRIVSYLGGVEICVPAGGINDPYSHLDLAAGKHLVTGDEALAFVRDRHGLADGSDLDRIEMQKMFLTSLISKIENAGTLQDAGQLYQLANITTSSITTDDALGSVGALLDLASQVQDIKPHDIDFVTMPTVQDEIDPNRVDPAPEADTLWALIRSDQGLDGASTAVTATPSPSASATTTGPTATVGTTSTVTSTAPAIPSTPGAPTPTGTTPPTTSTPPASPTSPPAIAADVQDRPADADICSNLPKPNLDAAAGY